VHRRKKATTDFNLLRDRLETEREHLIEELEQLKASVRQGGGACAIGDRNFSSERNVWW